MKDNKMEKRIHQKMKSEGGGKKKKEFTKTFCINLRSS